MDNIGLKRSEVELYNYNENYHNIYLEEKSNLEKLLDGMYLLST